MSLLLIPVLFIANGESFGGGIQRGNFFSSIFPIPLLGMMSFKNLLYSGRPPPNICKQITRDETKFKRFSHGHRRIG